MRKEHDLAGLIAGLCYVLAFTMVILALLTGCVEHTVTAPQLDTALDKLATLHPPVECRMLDLMPVPEQAHLVIEGDAVTADAGGEQLLRGYVRCRGAR